MGDCNIYQNAAVCGSISVYDPAWVISGDDNFHTQLLPTKLLLSFAAARQGVPFPGVVEVLLMELSFELLREAGVRLPGAMGIPLGSWVD